MKRCNNCIIIIIIIIISAQGISDTESEEKSSYENVNAVIIIFFTLGIYSEGGLKIDENKLKGYDAQSVQSGTGRLSCSRTATAKLLLLLLLLLLFYYYILVVNWKL